MKYEFTFLLPCLNEEKSLEYCLKEIKLCIKEKHLNAEILVADNGSEDNSTRIAKKYGARIAICKEKGYGSTLINGTNNAYGKYCIMGDCDGSYDFLNIDEFIKKARDDYDLIVGNRFKGGIEKGAMKMSHKIGVKLLTKFANLFFNTPVKDYHCGLRVYNTEKIKRLHLKQKGMEYATEMILISSINKLKIIEVPTCLRKDLREGKSHLRVIRDGMRHICFIIKVIINQSKFKIKEK